jgi:hypothetical protein
MSSWEEREERTKELFFGLIKTGIIAFAVMVIVLSIQNNAAWYNSFNKCLEVGGVPGEFPIPGSDAARFTCLPPSSPLVGGK